MTTTVFPYHRRARLINWIADTFVNEGLAAGNSLAYRVGARMAVDHINAGASEEELNAALDLFTNAWRAAAIPRLVEQQRRSQA
ncbi:hypothetical protein QO004_000481 [Rhizobium mesoamericanum]|uniref:hypothetical protein n=1 Tax=Rhizobium mesoamericanum TaxID=1079800 RepID=UPI002787FCE2|nr:hypothetical protein [Rhizobium mesoamericanum]MDQ0558706.1 hypothetical protein [Rhizobium mesoamericanum]